MNEQTPADKAEEILDSLKGAMTHADAAAIANAYAQISIADALAEIGHKMEQITEAISRAADHLDYLTKPRTAAPGDLFEQTKPKSLEDLHTLIDGPSAEQTPTSEFIHPIDAAAIITAGGIISFDPKKLSEQYMDYRAYTSEISAHIPTDKQHCLMQHWTEQTGLMSLYLDRGAFEAHKVMEQQSTETHTGTVKMQQEFMKNVLSPEAYERYVKTVDALEEPEQPNQAENPSKPRVKKSSEAENTIEAPQEPITPIQPKTIPEAIEHIRAGWAVEVPKHVAKQIEYALDNPDLYKRAEKDSCVVWVSQVPGSKIPAPNDPKGQQILDTELGLYVPPITKVGPGSWPTGSTGQLTNNSTGQTLTFFPNPGFPVVQNSLGQWEKAGSVVDGDALTKAQAKQQQMEEIQQAVKAKKAELEAQGLGEALKGSPHGLSVGIDWKPPSSEDLIADMRAMQKLYQVPQQPLVVNSPPGTLAKAAFDLLTGAPHDTGQQEPDDPEDLEDAWTEEHPGEDFPNGNYPPSGAVDNSDLDDLLFD